MMSPKYFNKYLLPRYQEVSEAIHDWDGKYILHTDGDITSQLDFIVESGFDGLQCLEPPWVDLYLVKKKVGDKLCLSGNIDTKHILVDAMGKGGGFMISPANFHPNITVDRLKWMIEAANKLGVYPLDNID
jgi:uroporphyrinogen decarboxylase